MMKKLNKIVAFNLALLLIYSLGIRIVSKISGGGSGEIMMASFTFILIHVMLCFILAAGFGMFGKGETGKSFFLAGSMVLVIGFGVCWGNSSI